MLINNYFKTDSEAIIYEKIKNMKSTNCIDDYCSYIYENTESEDAFEKEFINILIKTHEQLARKVTIKYLTDKYKDNDSLLEALTEVYINGIYCYDSQYNSEEMDNYFKGIFSNAEMLPFIQEHMMKAYEETKISFVKNDKEKQKDKIIDNIEYYKKTIDRYKIMLAEQEERLISLEK